MFIFFNIQAQKTNAPKFGKGIFNLLSRDNSWSMNIAARMQFLGVSKWDSNINGISNPVSSFNVRRARLKFNGFAFSEKLKYKMELGLSNQDISGGSKFTGNSPRYILDAVIKWNFYKHFELWVGQTKLPGNRERVVSSAHLQLVDRSLLNSQFNIDRDIGFQIRHHFKISDNFVIKEAITLGQGEGRNITTGNIEGHQYTARLDVLPFGEFKNFGDYTGSSLTRENKPKLAIGLTYDFNNNAVKNKGNLGVYMKNDIGFHKTNIKTVFVDAMFKYKNFSFMGEYANRNAKDPVAKNSDGTLTGDIVMIGSGLNLQSGYLFKKNWEITGRYTNINFDRKITKRGVDNQYTFGVSKYISGHNLKVQTDLSYLDSVTNKNELMYRLQVDIHF